MIILFTFFNVLIKNKHWQKVLNSNLDLRQIFHIFINNLTGLKWMPGKENQNFGICSKKYFKNKYNNIKL